MGKRMTWSKEKVINLIIERRNNGLSLASGVIEKEDKKLYQAGVREFKSWKNAVESTGIDYDSCLSIRRWTKDKVIDEIKNRKDNNLSLVSRDVSSTDSGLYNAARRLFKTWENAITKSGLNYESIIEVVFWTEQKIKEKLSSIYNGEYEFIEKIENQNKLKLKHKPCGNESYVIWGDFINEKYKSKRCLKCNSLKVMFPEIAEEWDYELNDKKPSDYFHASTKKVSWICSENTRHRWVSSIGSRTKQKTTCPLCSLPKGERAILTYLDDKLINYDFQFKFKEKPMSSYYFDFFIDKKVMIEYDGDQHFRPVDFAGKGEKWAKNEFKKNKKKDKIKNQHCVISNIPLIRVPYWEFDRIEYVLKNILIHFNLIESDNTYDRNIVLKYLVDENWDHDEYISSAPCNKKKVS